MAISAYSVEKSILSHGAIDGVKFGSYIDVMNEKTRCQIRLDPAVHERLKTLASGSDLSLNQLVEGILAWSVNNAYSGLPSIREDPPIVDTLSTPNVIWFGHDGAERDENGKIVDIYGEPGQVCFMLDFRATRAPVNGWEVGNVS